MKSYLDFPEGLNLLSPRRTMSEAHLVGFAGLTGDFYPLHTDELYARGSRFGQRVAHGPLVYSIAVGLMFESGVFDDVIVAFLGIKELQHLAPCYIGDTVQVDATVISARPTSKNNCGVVTMRYDVMSAADNRLLMTAQLLFLMHGERTARPSMANEARQ
jgi:acyl dehydratase